MSRAILRCRNFLSLGLHSTTSSPRFSSASLRNSVDDAVTPKSDPMEENARIRRQLALAYRLIDRLGLNEGACNHLTAMAPAKNGNGHVMLVTPGTLKIIFQTKVSIGIAKLVVSKGGNDVATKTVLLLPRKVAVQCFLHVRTWNCFFKQNYRSFG